jgi:hypothetical protein
MKSTSALSTRALLVAASLLLASPAFADSDPAVIRSVKLVGTTLTLQTDDLPRRLASDKKVFVEFNGVVVQGTLNTTTQIVTATIASVPPAGSYLVSILKENRSNRAGDDSVSAGSVQLKEGRRLGSDWV